MSTHSRQELENALPDYLFGVASPAVAEAIEALAETDANFASVLAAERRIAAALNGPHEFELERAPEHDFTRLKARIQSASVPLWRTWLQSARQLLPALTAAVVVAVGLLTVPIEDEGFRTLSDSEDSAVGQIRVIFREQPSAGTIAQFEHRYALQQEAGPDMAGSYVFSVDDTQELSEVLKALQEDAALSFVGTRE